MTDKSDGSSVREESSPDMGRKPTGRLELTWANKDKALLSHDDGSYEWVGKRDRRVAEVRLLRDAGSVGEVHDEYDRAKDNLLIRGDALHGLTALTQLPEFADEYLGKVKLVYIDPPFNTGQAFEQYDDGIEHSVWLTMMRDRLVQIKKLLSPDGSIWVHLDDYEQAYARVLMDEIFGREGFVSTIVWEKRPSRSNDAIFSSSHDYIMVYSPDRAVFAKQRNRLTRSAEQLKAYKNPDKDPRGDWVSVSFQAPNVRPNLTYPIVGPDGTEHWPSEGRCWSTTKEQFEELMDDGRIYFGADGKGVPRKKKFLTEDEGIVPNTWWPNDECGSSSEAKKEILALFPGLTAFATPKPERLISRIIEIGSNPGDVVLDCFGGSGTTAAVAHKMGRRWVLSERESETIDTFAAPRLSRVVIGEDDGGITKSAGWNGGGGFRTLDVAPSMFQEEEGLVFLADWATSSDLAEAVSAQLGFEFEPEAPFTGRKGRVRLAVIDGHVNRDVARALVNSLEKGERLSLVATSVEPGLDEALSKMRGGSRARVAPEDLLIAYATPSSWRVSVAREPRSDAEAQSESSALEAEEVT